MSALFGVLAAVGAIFIIRKLSAGALGKLSTRYPALNSGSSQEFLFQSLSVRFSGGGRFNLGFCTAVGLSEQSLNVRVQFPFHFLLSPFSLPWASIHKVEVKRSVLGSQIAYVSVKDYSNPLEFSSRSAQPIYERWLQLRGRNA